MHEQDRIWKEKALKIEADEKRMIEEEDKRMREERDRMFKEAQKKLDEQQAAGKVKFESHQHTEAQVTQWKAVQQEEL